MGKNRKIRIHAIGNAHIDPVWLWDWQEGCSETISTFRSAVERLKEYPDFIFTAGGAQHYKWVEELDPGLFREIKKYVRSGRWRIVNGWWVQPDCNIPSGESFVRQCLYGKRYFKDKFGIDVKTGYNVDSFGHNASLPQILSKAGFKYYVFFRPIKSEKDLPAPVFRWRSKDGSSILASRPMIPEGKPIVFYCTGPEELKEVIDRTQSVLRKAGCEEGLFLYGVGNHGGGPTKKNIESIMEYNKTGGDAEIIFSSTDKFFRSAGMAKNDPPLLEDELQRHAVGCYTAHSEIKKLNRMAENTVFTAELFGALAYKFLKYKYPGEELTECWHNILFNQFHDILAGSSVAKAYEQARDSYGGALHAARRVLDSSLRFIAGREPSAKKIPSGDAGRTNGVINIFNPLSWKRSEYIKLHLFPYDWEAKDFTIRDAKGNILPSQRVKGGSPLRPHALIYAGNIPPCGYKTVSWEPAPGKNTPGHSDSSLKITENLMENNFWVVKINNDTGYMESLYDKTHKVEVLNDNSNIPVIIEDPSDTWGKGMENYREEAGRFRKTKAVIEETGPLRAVLKITSTYNRSVLEQDIILYAHTDKIDFKTRLCWQEEHKMLKIRFALNLKNAKATASIPYGCIERKDIDGGEETAQAWLDISGKALNRDNESVNYGVGFINDSKYAYDLKDNILRLSILRSPLYAAGYWVTLEDNISYEFMDQGEHFFAYQLYPHKNSWNRTELVNRAYEFNIPPELITATYQYNPGSAKNNADLSFIEIEPKTVMITTVKKCEKDGSLILRVLETAGKDTEAELKFSFIDCRKKFRIGHDEIKTFKFDLVKNKAALRQVNLLEE